MHLNNYKEILAWPLLLGGVGLIVWTVWDFVDRHGLPGFSVESEPVLKISNEIRSKSLTYKVDEIVAAHLFGEPAKAKQNLDQAPKTKLKLSLLGVLATDNDDYARALIQVQSKKMRTYSVGDIIEGTDAALHKVESQRVILDRKGKFESLGMQRKNLATTAGPSARTFDVPPAPGTGSNRDSTSPIPF
ncbi:MAG: type II secretion system protein N [Arenicellales bacterium]|nr:type II secretion system protein N [Arenicellales bacterium]